VVKGERQLLTPHEIKVALAAKTWHTLVVEHRGEDIRVFVGEKSVFEGKDRTYAEAGRIGVWVKADSLTHFDDLTAEELRSGLVVTRPRASPGSASVRRVY
jgi:hypothetical protein